MLLKDTQRKIPNTIEEFLKLRNRKCVVSDKFIADICRRIKILEKKVK